MYAPNFFGGNGIVGAQVRKQPISQKQKTFICIGIVKLTALRDVAYKENKHKKFTTFSV